MKRPLLVALLIGLVVWPGAYCPGLNMTADHFKSAQAAGIVGAKTCRVEFSASAPATSLDASITALANNGCQPLLLASIGLSVTTAQATNLGSWAARFGNGGSFWDIYAGTDLPVRFIEFGNETSYRNGAPDGPGAGDDWWASQAYIDRARNYGARAIEATFSINAQNPDVKLLVQADSGGSRSPNWVNGVYFGRPGIHDLIGGWVVHPYGPQSRWQPKVQDVIDHTAANGAPNTVPIDATEYGISSDNGRALTDNYGHPVNLTYAQAAAALRTNVDAIRAYLGDRLQHFIIYSAYDLRAPGFGTPPVDREWYFGGLQDDLEPKGAYTVEAQDVLAGN